MNCCVPVYLQVVDQYQRSSLAFSIGLQQRFCFFFSLEKAVLLEKTVHALNDTATTESFGFLFFLFADQVLT
jgi:hypothetical protein